ncbi:MAG: hypothetical protein AB7U46_09145 [Paenirhodobacter sp.]
MKDHAIRIFSNDRLIEATHWTVFSLGALSLAVAIGGTAWTHFFA